MEVLERQPMDEQSTHLTSDEIRRIFARLRPADIVRLSALARTWATGLRQHDVDDLLNEALDRVLSGRRPWPSHLPLPVFLSQVMRSISGQWRRELRREPLIEDERANGPDEQGENPTPSHEMGDLIARMRDALVDDANSLGVFDHILADSDREEAQAAMGIDAARYDTARRRMVRHLFNSFHSGWNL
jgi:DNA-directed RNA polymerase specialized sigma24 family protein